MFKPFFLLKALVGLGLLIFLLSRIEILQLLHVISSAHLSYLALAGAAYFLAKVVTAVRWAMLARPLGFNNPLKEFANYYFIGMFFNLVAPSTLGGDAGRVVYLSRGGGSQSHWTGQTAFAFLSVLADRAMGLVILVWIGAAALVIFPDYSVLVPPAVRYLISALALGFLLGGIFLPLLGRFLRWTGRDGAKNLAAAIEIYWNSRHILLQAVFLSLIAHVIQTWIQVLLGRALDLDLPWSYCFIFFPLVDIFTMLPLSLSGIGLREVGYLSLLGRLGISPEKAIACGLLWFIIVTLNGLLGGIAFVFRGNS